MTISNVNLQELLDLEVLEEGLYRGISWDLGFPAVFGGQVLGQALVAAYKTVNKDQYAHSFHSYFLLPGDASKPIVYDVEVVREGRSFSTRRVKAIQHGKTIFYMTASFQLEQPGLSHQYGNLPRLPDPDSLDHDIDLFAKKHSPLSPELSKTLEYHKPIDIKTVNIKECFGAAVVEPERFIWMRSRHAIRDELIMHQAALAYASDYHFLSTALQAHPIHSQDPRLRMATIDHAVWFHKPLDFNQWHIYHTQSPFSGNSRALVKGQFFTASGEIVATTMQEGMIRIKE